MRRSLTVMLIYALALVAIPARAQPLLEGPFNPLVLRGDVLTLQVERSSPVLVSGAALAAAGWPIAQIDARAVHLYRQGVELPLSVTGSVDGSLAPDTSFAFMAHASHSRYGAQAVYWLAHDAELGLRGPLPTTTGEVWRWQPQLRYESRFGERSDDHWYGRELFAGGSVSATLQLPFALPVGARLRLRLLGEELRDHTLRVLANGAAIGTLRWSDTRQPQPFEAELLLPVALPAGPLRLDLALESPGLPTDVVLLDWIALPELEMPAAPLLVNPPLTPMPATDLRQGPGADYLIISHADFAGALAPLVAAKQRTGKRVALLDVQAAYNAWSGGEPDPEAIRWLIRVAAARWHPAPRAVLLVGAGSVRMRAEAGEAATSFIPPYLLPADPWLGEVACDGCYTRLDADDVADDPLPDIAIGRFPVRSAAEAAMLAQKTADYLNNPPTGAWRSTALVMADNDTLPDGTPDAVGGFAEAAARAAALATTGGLHAQQLLYDPTGAAPPRYADPDELRCVLFAALDGTNQSCRYTPAAAMLQGSRGEAPPFSPLKLINTPTMRLSAQAPSRDGRGAALLAYIGHGSPWQWAQTALDAPVPYLWYLYDADARRNAGRLPILLAMTCLTGAWQNPELQTTDERLLLAPQGGIVASLSASGMGVNNGHEALLAGALPVLTAREGPRSLGAAHLAGLAQLQAIGCCKDLAYTYGILGDPEVELPLPLWQVRLPVVAR